MLSITSTIRTYPKHRYADMANKILGTRYDLSLVFIGATRATTLNKTYRNKTYSPNVLSFPLEDGVGEIFICPQVAAAEARRHGFADTHDYVAFLFIHGCLHLKGHAHGDTMEKLENKWCKHFGLR